MWLATSMRSSWAVGEVRVTTVVAAVEPVATTKSLPYTLRLDRTRLSSGLAAAVLLAAATARQAAILAWAATLLRVAATAHLTRKPVKVEQMAAVEVRPEGHRHLVAPVWAALAITVATLAQPRLALVVVAVLVAWVLWEVLHPVATVVQACFPASQDQASVAQGAAQDRVQRVSLPELTAVAHPVLSTVRRIPEAVLRVAVNRLTVATVAAVS
jgi:hypothetical protein